MMHPDVVPISIYEFKQRVEQNKKIRELMDMLIKKEEIYPKKPGGKRVEITTSMAFRHVLYSLCCGAESVNDMDTISKDKETASVSKADKISARTISRRYMNMDMDILLDILRKQSEINIKRVCNKDCQNICVLDMSEHIKIKFVAARYICLDHKIMQTLDIEILTEKEHIREEEKEGEGESTAAKRLLPRVIEKWGEYIKTFVQDGYYTYWFMDLVEKQGLHYAIKTKEETLLVIEEAQSLIKQAYKEAPKDERLIPIKWEDKYKKYIAYEIPNVKYISGTKNPREEKSYRVIQFKETRKRTKKERNMLPEEFFVITNIPSEKKNVQEIRWLVRKGWEIENNLFRKISQSFKSKNNHRYFRKNKNAKICLLITFLIAENALGDYMMYKKRNHEFLKKYKGFTVKKLKEKLLETWKPRFPRIKGRLRERKVYIVNPRILRRRLPVNLPLRC